MRHNDNPEVNHLHASGISEEEVRHGRNAFFIAITGLGFAAQTEMSTSLEAAGVIAVAALGAAAIEGARALRGNE